MFKSYFEVVAFASGIVFLGWYFLGTVDFQHASLVVDDFVSRNYSVMNAMVVNFVLMLIPLGSLLIFIPKNQKVTEYVADHFITTLLIAFVCAALIQVALNYFVGFDLWVATKLFRPN